jgi:hypothetical protein
MSSAPLAVRSLRAGVTPQKAVMRLDGLALSDGNHSGTWLTDRWHRLLRRSHPEL